MGTTEEEVVEIMEVTKMEEVMGTMEAVVGIRVIMEVVIKTKEGIIQEIEVIMIIMIIEVKVDKTIVSSKIDIEGCKEPDGREEINVLQNIENCDKSILISYQIHSI